MISLQNFTTLEPWHTSLVGNDFAYPLRSLSTVALIGIHVYIVCPRVSQMIRFVVKRSWLRTPIGILPEISSCVRIGVSLAERVQGLWYLIRGPSSLQAGYTRADGGWFKQATPSNNHLMVTSERHVQEVASAPFQQLSLHAVAKEMLQPKYTMYGFEWKDQRGIEGTGFVRALRSLLTAHLPSLLPSLSSNIAECFESEMALHRTARDSSRVRVFPMAKRVVTRANCLIFFGADLSQNDEFNVAALEFPQAVVFAAEVLRITPRCLMPLVARMATGGHRAATTLMKHLRPVVEARLEARDRPHSGSKPVDCMQWVIDTSPRKTAWSPERMIGEIMALWFGSVHQLAMTTTYAIHDLCLQPYWMQEMRSELSRVGQMSITVDPESLPLLDAFIQESMRINPSDAISGRRKAIEPFRFSDGLLVRTGDWVCLPQQAMMKDERLHPRPACFDPTRFLNRQRLQDLWPVWGLGTAACPGRFYASLAMKLVLMHILQHYNCKLVDRQAARTLSWRSSILPRSSSVVLFRKRRNSFTTAVSN